MITKRKRLWSYQIFSTNSVWRSLEFSWNSRAKKVPFKWSHNWFFDYIKFYKKYTILSPLKKMAGEMAETFSNIYKVCLLDNFVKKVLQKK